MVHIVGAGAPHRMKTGTAKSVFVKKAVLQRYSLQRIWFLSHSRWSEVGFVAKREGWRYSANAGTFVHNCWWRNVEALMNLSSVFWKSSRSVYVLYRLIRRNQVKWLENDNFRSHSTLVTQTYNWLSSPQMHKSTGSWWNVPKKMYFLPSLIEFSAPTFIAHVPFDIRIRTHSSHLRNQIQKR